MENITPCQLLSASTVFVSKSSSPLADELPQMSFGNQALDGGGLVLKSGSDKAEADNDPIAAKYIRLYLGARELIQNKNRWCLWLVNSTPEDRKHSKFLRERFEKVREFRATAKTPIKAENWEFASIRQPSGQYMAVPRIFSENRQYFTATYEPEEVIASEDLFVCSDPDGFAFSVIESSMFMAWQNLVGGRIKEDYRFSSTLVWNTFPLPKLTKDQKDCIIEGGAKVLEARANYPKSSLADLYDPDNMPSDLKKAHEALDKAMDSVFSNKPFEGEEERQRALLESYEKMTGEKEG